MSVFHLMTKNKLFLITVVIPTTVTIVYFGLFASNVYVSESKFVVKSSQKQALSSFGMALQGTGLLKTQEDSYMVEEYTTSRDALTELNKTLKIENHYKNNGDIFQRFCSFGIKYFGSNESFYKYYQNHIVEETIDTTSGVTKLTTRAFDSNTATTINEKLLEMSESLVNSLNDRARNDTVGSAQKEVDRLLSEAKKASSAVAFYRSSNGVFDPEKQSALQLEVISKLQEDLINTKSQLSEIEAITPENSQVGSLKTHIALLTDAIASETAKVTGSKGSLASKAGGYDSLVATQSYAEKQLEMALSNLEQARSDAEHKQLYIELIAKPSAPDTAMEPKRIKNIAIVFFFGLMMFAISSILATGAREHME